MIKTCKHIYFSTVVSQKDGASKSITVYFTGKLVSLFSTHLQFCKS